MRCLTHVQYSRAAIEKPCTPRLITIRRPAHPGNREPLSNPSNQGKVRRVIETLRGIATGVWPDVPYYFTSQMRDCGNPTDIPARNYCHRHIAACWVGIHHVRLHVSSNFSSIHSIVHPEILKQRQSSLNVSLLSSFGDIAIMSERKPVTAIDEETITQEANATYLADWDTSQITSSDVIKTCLLRYLDREDS